jgi:CxxC-x17-CxxC domain-containing protein
MGNFQGGNNNRGGGFRGGNGGGGRSNFRGGDREVTMHKTTCDECKKSCEVPFRPSGDKPVYCSDCFSTKRDDGNRGGNRNFDNKTPRRDFNDRPNNSSTQQPIFSKVVGSSDETKKQLAEINTKLDRLINAIEKLSQPKAEVKPVVKVLPVVVKKVEIKKAPTLKAVVKKAIETKAPAKKVVVKKVITKKKK